MKGDIKSDEAGDGIYGGTACPPVSGGNADGSGRAALGGTGTERWGAKGDKAAFCPRGQNTRQFLPLKEKKRLDLSLEALVIQGKYAELFTDEEVDQCLQQLLDAGMF